MIPLRDQLICISDSYCHAIGLSRSRVSTMIFNGGHVIDRIANGGDLATGNFERAMRWFSDNWPVDTAWPEGIARPAPRPEEAA